MKSGLASEAFAIVAKEARSEMRNKSAGYTAFMLSVITVFTMAFAFYGRKLTGDGGAGLLWTALLFAGVGTVSRAFVAEEELGTGDLLRLWARPEAVFWGKVAYAFLQMLATGAMVSLLFVVLSGLDVARFGVLALSLVGGAVALAATVTLSSALIAKGANRGALAGVVALPLLVPLVALGVTAGRAAFGGASSQPWEAVAGIWMYALLVLAVGPYVFSAVWRES